MNKYIFILFLVFFLFSCIKEEFDSQLLSDENNNSSSVALPIGYRKLTLKELFAPQTKEGKITEDANGMLYFIYKLPFSTIKASDLIQFHDRNSDKIIINNTNSDIDLNTITNPVIISDFVYVDFSYSNGMNNEIIDSIVVNNLDLNLAITSAFSINGILKVTFPDMKYRGVAYSKDLHINTLNQFRDIQGYSLHLINNSSLKNKLLVQFSLTLNQSPCTIVNLADILNITLNFSNIDYQILYGYIGQISRSLPNQTVVFDFHQRKIDGYFHFEYPAMKIVSDNSFGVPFAISLNNIQYITKNLQTNQISLSGAYSPSNPALIKYPRLNEVGRTISDSSSIDLKSFDLFTSNYATSASMNFQAQSNPNGNADYNFVSKESKLDLYTKFEIPFWGNTDNLVMQDTMKFVFQDFYKGDVSKVNRFLFVINFQNIYPVDIEPQIYLADETCKIIDSMFVNKIFIDGLPNAETFNSEPAWIGPYKTAFEKIKINKLLNTKYLLIRAKIKTLNYTLPNPVSYKFFSKYYFNVHVGFVEDISK